MIQCTQSTFPAFLTSSHPHILTSSHPHILTSSHPHILTSKASTTAHTLLDRPAMFVQAT